MALNIQLYKREEKRLKKIHNKYQKLYLEEYDKLIKKMIFSRIIGKIPYDIGRKKTEN